MSPAKRAWLGAALGALLTLALHPLSRPFITSVFVLRAPDLSKQADESASPNGQTFDVSDSFWWQPVPRPLAPPTNRQEASVWIRVAAEKLYHRAPTKFPPPGSKIVRIFEPGEIRTVIEICRAAADKDPDNAYWPQMEAVFLKEAGRIDEARKAWMHASSCASWNDLQTTHLMGIRNQLAADLHADFAWQLAYVYYVRSPAAARVIEAFARWINNQADLETEGGLRLRYATLVNGELLRDGSRNLKIGEIGVDMLELASHPPGLRTTTQTHYRKLLVARYNLHNALQNHGMPTQAAHVQSAYANNDGWLAFTAREDTVGHLQELTLGSLLAACVPGALFAVAILGGVFWMTGLQVRKYSSRQTRLKVVYAAIFALATAAAVFAITGLPLAGIATGSSCLFLTFSPKNERTLRPNSLGPLFDFTMATFAFVLSIIFVLFLIGLTIPAFATLPNLGVPREFYGGSPLLLGLCAIIMAMLLLAAPFWAMAQRLGSLYVLGFVFRRFGGILAIGGLVLSIVVTPLAVMVDHGNKDTLQQLVQNEPTYYLIK